VLACLVSLLVGTSAMADDLVIRNPHPSQRYIFTLAQDQFRAIRIVSDNVSLDCQGYSVIGNGDYYGIDVSNVQNVEIMNCDVAGWITAGIRLQRSPNSYLRSNTVRGNGTGMSFEAHSINIYLLENLFSENFSYGLKITGAVDEMNNPGVIRLVRNAFFHNGPADRAATDPSHHYLILSRGLVTKPLETYGNRFNPPLPPVE
jgi:parallel beta-helix repeat protein